MKTSHKESFLRLKQITNPMFGISVRKRAWYKYVARKAMVTVVGNYLPPLWRTRKYKYHRKDGARRTYYPRSLPSLFVSFSTRLFSVADDFYFIFVPKARNFHTIFDQFAADVEMFTDFSRSFSLFDVFSQRGKRHKSRRAD